MTHGQELTSESYVTKLNPLKESSIKQTALYEEEAGVDNDQDTVLGDTVPEEEAEATAGAVCVPPSLGVQLSQSLPPESENQFEEAGGQNPDTGTTNALTDSHHFILL